MDSGNALLLHMDYDWEEAYGPLVCNVDSRIYILPAGEPVEVPTNEMRMVDGREYRYDVASAILETRGPNHGIVRVPSTHEKVKDSKGRQHLVFSYDIDAAQEESKNLLEAIGDRMIADYISGQQQRIKEAGPAGAVPPSGRVAIWIEKRGVDLAAYNINPPGWDRRLGISTSQLASENETLKGQVAEMQKQLDRLSKAMK